MIDERRLDPDERELWDEFFPGGFWAGAPHEEGPRLRLWSFGYWCMLELGRVPAPVVEVFEGRRDMGANIRAYIDRRREAGRDETAQ